MSFANYDSYIASSIVWIGDIPAHWKSQRLKTLFLRQQRDHSENDGIVTAFRDGTVTLRSRRRTEGFTNALKEIGYQGVKAGDLVIHAMDAFAGAIGVSEDDGKSSPVYSVCAPSANVDAHYYGYLLRYMAATGFIASLSKGVRERSTEFRWADAGNLPVPLPPIQEQSCIVHFLDLEIAKIDTLVEEQKRLIELLKEKRQAVISHAVTKGLDPNAPMKDSGIEWLGEVPAHWNVRKGSEIGELFGTEQKSDDPATTEGSIPYLKVGSLSPHGFEVESWDWFIDESAVNKSKLRCDFIVFPKRGAAIYSNKVNIVKIPAMIDPNLMGWSIWDDNNLEFIAYSLICREISSLADVSTVPQINNKHVYPEKFPSPPLSEQSDIVKYISRELEKLNALVEESEMAISLLNERRSALISAAVTGKIDVRGLIPMKAEAA